MKKIFLSIIITTLLLISCSQSPKSKLISFGTGSVGGTDNVVIEAMSSVVNGKSTLKTATVTTSGGAEIITLISAGELQGGFSGTIDMVNAINGTEPFNQAIPQKDLLQAFGFVIWALPVIVLDSSPIKSYEDLEGKNLGMPPAASSTTAVINLLLEAYNLKDKVNIDYFTWSEGFTALKDGRIDAFIGSYANGSPISGIIEIESTTPLRCLSASEEMLNKVNQMNSGVSIAKLTSAENKLIPEGEEVLAPANSGVIILSSSVSEEDAYTYTKTVLDNIEELKKISSYFNAFNSVVVDVCVPENPFHPGAAKALKEAGLWKDEFTIFSNN